MIKLSGLVSHNPFKKKIAEQGDDDKYTHIGYGKYKEKGKEKDDDADTFQKTDNGKYVPFKKDGGGEKDKPEPKKTKIDADPFADDDPDYDDDFAVYDDEDDAYFDDDEDDMARERDVMADEIEDMLGSTEHTGEDYSMMATELENMGHNTYALDKYVSMHIDAEEAGNTEKANKLAQGPITKILQKHQKKLQENRMPKLKNLLEEISFENDAPKINKHEVIESVAAYGQLGKQLYSYNITEMAQKLVKIAEDAQSHVLSETDEWFDKVSINRNMGSLKGMVKEFKKGATEYNALNQRLTALYEDMGTILNRYYDISEVHDNGEHEPVKGDKEEYQKFFKGALKKFGVTEPDQLEGSKKKDFFNYVDKNWVGDEESD